MQWFRLYMGVYERGFPDVSASLFPESFTTGSRMHINPQCTSLAISYTGAEYSMVPAGACVVPPGSPCATTDVHILHTLLH